MAADQQFKIHLKSPARWAPLVAAGSQILRITEFATFSARLRHVCHKRKWREAVSRFIYSCDLELDPMTLINGLDLKIF